MKLGLERVLVEHVEAVGRGPGELAADLVVLEREDVAGHAQAARRAAPRQRDEVAEVAVVADLVDPALVEDEERLRGEVDGEVGRELPVLPVDQGQVRLEGHVGHVDVAAVHELGDEEPACDLRICNFQE